MCLTLTPTSATSLQVRWTAGTARGTDATDSLAPRRVRTNATSSAHFRIASQSDFVFYVRNYVVTTELSNSRASATQLPTPCLMKCRHLPRVPRGIMLVIPHGHGRSHVRGWDQSPYIVDTGCLTGVFDQVLGLLIGVNGPTVKTSTSGSRLTLG
jgi:hypothetical protein